MDIPWRTDAWWKAARSHNLEYRYPLLDQRVLRVALAMPPWYFHGHGYKRWGFRQLAAEYLPRECAMHEDKSEPLRVTELLNSDMWQDRVERNHAASPRLAELTRIQRANVAARWSGPEAHRAQLLATLDRVRR